jgi:hypothetical protein
VLAYNAGGAGTAYGVATGTVAAGTGISVTAGQSIIGSGLTITNTGVTSLSAGTGISVSASTGAVTVTNGIGYPFALAGNATSTLTQFNGNASTTQLSAYKAYFGGSATSTFDSAGVLTLASPLAIASGGTFASSFGTTNGITVYDGTRLVNFSGYTLTSSVLTVTNASTTALSVNNKEVIGDHFLSASVASSTWTATSSDNRITAPFSGTLTSALCKTNAGTVNVQYIINGTNVSSMFNASTTVGTITFSGANTFTKGQLIEVDFGTPATSPTNASCTAASTITGL